MTVYRTQYIISYISYKVSVVPNERVNKTFRQPSGSAVPQLPFHVTIRASEAAHAAFSSFCPRQNLFHTDVEPVEAMPGPLDITHTPTAQELLAHRVLQRLQEEKSESRRYRDRLFLVHVVVELRVE